LEKLSDRLGVRGASVFVSDVGREEFDEAPDSAPACCGDYCRKFFKPEATELAAG